MYAQEAPPKPVKPLGRELLTLALPLMLSNLAYTLIGLTDTAFMGRVGTVEVGAVGLGNLLILTLQLLFRGSLETVTVFAARFFGEGNPLEVGRTYGRFLMLALVLAIPVTLLAYPALEGILFLLKPAPDVLEALKSYTHLRFLEIGFVLLSSVNLGFMLGIGNSRTPMLISWATVLLNGVLAYVLTFPLEQGIRGVGLATLIALTAQAALSSFLVWRLYSKTYTLRPFFPARADLPRILKVAAPAGATQLLEVSAFTAFLGIISQLGPRELAASQVSNQLASIGFMPAFALANATGSLLSRYLGEKRPDLAARVGWMGAIYGSAAMGILALFFVFTPLPLIRVFTDKEELYPLAIQIMRLMALYQILDGLGIILGGALQGAGDTRFRLWVTVLGSWGIMVPLAYWLSAGPLGLNGAWLGALVYFFFAAALYVWRFSIGRWKRSGLLSAV